MKFSFTVTDVTQELLLKYPPFAVDGTLTIVINDTAFFSEEGVSLLDLAISVNVWLYELKTKPTSDFDYSSDEYQENPVLHLVRTDEHHYGIFSAWVQNGTNLILKKDEVIRCFRNFLHELDTTIQRDYGVAFSDMRFFNPPWPPVYPA